MHQQFSLDAAGSREHLGDWGLRLRTAMGEGPGSPGAPPTFRMMAAALRDVPWTVRSADQRVLYVVPYVTAHDGWEVSTRRGNRHGFLQNLVNSEEYAHGLWDEMTSRFHPDLLDPATFGAWLELLPQPASLLFRERSVRLQWAATEPRVVASDAMPRYRLAAHKREIFVDDVPDGRIARAEAYVRAWEAMAANDRPVP